MIPADLLLFLFTKAFLGKRDTGGAPGTRGEHVQVVEGGSGGLSSARLGLPTQPLHEAPSLGHPAIEHGPKEETEVNQACAPPCSLPEPISIAGSTPSISTPSHVKASGSEPSLSALCTDSAPVPDSPRIMTDTSFEDSLKDEGNLMAGTTRNKTSEVSKSQKSRTISWTKFPQALRNNSHNKTVKT